MRSNFVSVDILVGLHRSLAFVGIGSRQAFKVFDRDGNNALFWARELGNSDFLALPNLDGVEPVTLTAEQRWEKKKEDDLILKLVVPEGEGGDDKKKKGGKKKKK